MRRWSRPGGPGVKERRSAALNEYYGTVLKGVVLPFRSRVSCGRREPPPRTRAAGVLTMENSEDIPCACSGEGGEGTRGMLNSRGSVCPLGVREPDA